MAVDINRIVLAAAEAALKQDAPAKSKGLSTGRALAAGATLVVVGRVAAGPGGRFVRDKIQERLSNDPESEDPRDEELDEEPEAVVDEDEEPEAEVDDEELEAEVDDAEEPEAEFEEEEPEAEFEEEEPEAEVEEEEEPEAEFGEEEPEAEFEEEEPEAEFGEEEPEAEVDEETGLEEDGKRGNGARRPRHHPLFEQALAGKGAPRRRSPQPPKGRKPTGRPRIAPPRRPTRPSTNGG